MAQSREEILEFVRQVNCILEKFDCTPQYHPLTLREGQKWIVLFSEHQKVPYLRLDKDLNIYSPSGKKVIANIRDSAEWVKHIGPNGLRAPRKKN